ncbi:hypothetical protein [Virgibacillus dokdonensis]
MFHRTKQMSRQFQTDEFQSYLTSKTPDSKVTAYAFLTITP